MKETLACIACRLIVDCESTLLVKKMRGEWTRVRLSTFLHSSG